MTPTVSHFTRDALARYRQWLGIASEMRATLQQRYPTREAAIEAMEYGDFVARRDAIRVLGALGEHDAVLHYALIERESSWIPTLACEILVQPPLDVLVAWVTRMKPSGDGSRLGEVVATQLPKFNFEYIGEPLIDFFSKQKPKLKTLSPDDLLKLGASALAPAARLLRPHAALDTLRTYAQALADGVPAKTCRPAWAEFMRGEEHRALDRASTSAIFAACALRRLRQPVDTARVADWLRQIPPLFRTEDVGRYPVNDYVSRLRWVLFDAGDDSQMDAMLGPDGLRIRHDVAMTLLLRGDRTGFERWLRSIPAEYPGLVHPPREVYYWPLIDHLQARGIGNASGAAGAAGDGYLLARAAGVAAPHGWAWQSVPGDD